MFARMQGGAVAQRALLLALFFFILSSGCRREAPAPSAPRSVRLDALLPLHPAWTHTQTLTQEAIPAPPLPAAGHTAAKPLPVLLRPPRSFSSGLSKARLIPIEAYNLWYLRQLTTNLRRRNQETLTREERAEKRRMEAQIAQERAKREAELRAEFARKAAPIEREIRALRLREIAAQAQIRVFNGQPLQDAQIQRDQLRSLIAERLEEQKPYLADVRPLVAEEMRKRRGELTAEITRHLSERRQELESAVAKLEEAFRNRQARQGLGLSEAEEIPPMGTAPSPVANRLAIPLVLSPPPDLSAAYRQAQAQVETALAQRRAQTDARQEALLTILRTDTQKAVQDIARARGWQLVAPGSPNATDATSEAAVALRAQWRIGE